MKKFILPASIVFLILFIVLYVVSKNSLVRTKVNTPIEVQNEKVIELKLAHHQPQESLLHRAALHFANEVEKKTQGKVKITLFPNQELGSNQKMLELSKRGEIDILATPTAKMSTDVPSMQYVDLPFLFQTKKDAYTLLDGKVGALLLEDLKDKGLFGLGFWDAGFKNFTSNKPLLKVEDFKDLKIRVMKSRMLMDEFNSLKAKPIPIDFHSVKQALKDGVVEAQENPLNVIRTMAFNEVQSDMTLSKHSYIAYVMTISQQVFSKLPLDVKNVLIQTAIETKIWNRKELIKEEEKDLKTLIAAGLNVHTLSANERKRFSDTTSFVMKKYEDVFGSHIVSKTEEYFYKKENNENIVAIGIDADLSMGAKGAGLAIKRGVALAVNDINENGGLLGKKVIVVAKDHRGTTTQAKENIKDFVSDKNIFAVIGGKHSAIVFSYIKQIQDNKLIFFSPWAAATSLTENGYKDNYIFRVSLNDRFATEFLAKEALKKASNPAIVVENSIWGKEALQNINRYLESKNLPKQEGYIINRGYKNFDKEFQDIKKKRHDSILLVLNSEEAKRIVFYMGENQIKLPIISHWGIVGDTFYNLNKKYLGDIDLRFIQTFSLTQKNKVAKKLEQNYIQKYSHSSHDRVNAPTGVTQAYDSVMLLARAVKDANSFSSNKVKEALENINIYKGALKTYKKPFTKLNHDALKMEDFFMAKFNGNGDIVPVKE